MRTSYALALCAILASGALLPLAQGAHYTLYHDSTAKSALGSQAAFATFEGTAPISERHNNVNGPEGQETRAVPAENNVPPSFHGLTDILVSDLGLACVAGTQKPCTTNGTAALTDGAAIFDVHFFGSVVQAGHLAPYNYYAAKSGGGNRMYPAGTFGAWHGYWWDVNGDNVINDKYVACAATSGACDYRESASDEFVWRGANTDEGGLSAVGFFFPRDGSADSRIPPYDPIGFDGNCDQWGSDSNPDCVSPAPDFLYADETDAAKSDNANNQRYSAGSGGGRYYYEEGIITSLHVVSVIGAASTPSAPETIDVTCASSGGSHGGRGCFRDYDWFNNLAGAGVESLYYDVTRPVRDAVWVPLEETSLNDILTETGLSYIPAVCPYKPVQYCRADERHLYARQGVAADNTFSEQRAWTTLDIWMVVPELAGTNPDFNAYWCSQVLGPAGYDYKKCFDTLPPAQGFYGDRLGYRVRPENSTMQASGAIMRPIAGAWIWDDKNGDGYIGAPYAEEVVAYNQGIESSPNNDCEVGALTPSGKPCEVISRSDVFVGHVARVTPGPAGWPPGAFVLRRYENPTGGKPLNPGGPDWLEASTPLFASNPVDLRYDGAYCLKSVRTCRTIDAVTLPTGSTGFEFTVTVGKVAGDLNTGTFTHGVGVTWEENAVPYTATFASFPNTQQKAQAYPDHYPPVILVS